MPQVAIDADAYAEARQNQFFTGVTPDLDGQCVSLVKWFLQEMSDVPNPQAARGDARYVGKTLVAQGHAVEVPYSERKCGDIVCYEYGTYGHISVQLSGGRVFEENVNWTGVSSKIVAGERVYASRIGNENESWRHDQHVYRLKTYKEGNDMVPDNNVLQSMSWSYRQFAASEEEQKELIGKISIVQLMAWWDTGPRRQYVTDMFRLGELADKDHWADTINRMYVENADLQQQLTAAQKGFVPYSGEQLFTAVIKK